MKATAIMRRLICLVICFAMVWQPLSCLSLFAEENTNLLVNGTFADANSDGKADGWSYSAGSVAEAYSYVDESGLSVIADSGDRKEGLTVSQQVEGLDADKTYRITGTYILLGRGGGYLEIRHNASEDSAGNRLAYQTKITKDAQQFEKTITGVTSLKIEIVVSAGATLICTVSDFRLEEVVMEPEAPAEAQITGVCITVDGQTCTEGEVIINPDSTVVFTVSGTGFANLTGAQQICYAPGLCSRICEEDGWVVDPVIGTAVKDVTESLSAFASCDQFAVTFSSDMGSTWGESGIFLTFQQPAGPIMIRQPVSFEGNLQDLATFTVVAQGEGLCYQWYYYDAATESWKKSYATGCNDATLEVPFLAYRDGQKYRCEITEAQGNVLITNVVTMTLKQSPVEILSHPVGVTNAVLDERYTFTVEAAGENLTYQWEYSADGGETWTRTWLEGNSTAALTVDMKPNRDGNQYRCVVSSVSDRKITEPAVLKLPECAAQITRHPVDATAIPGTTVSFNVEACGDGLGYTWYRSDDGGDTWKQTWLSGYDTPTLSFAANASRAVMYKCLVSDISGKGVWSDAVTLTMQTATTRLTVTGQPADVECLGGEMVTFAVAADGEGLTYAWYRSPDGINWTRTWMSGYDTDVLSFAATAGREDLYRCVITDKYGDSVTTEAARFQLKEIELKITQQPACVTIAQGGTVTFRLEAQGNGLTYRWYASADGQSWTPSWLEGYSTDTLSFVGIESRISKQYKCVITDVNGCKVESMDVSAAIG